jgi:hypothetical protein
MADALGRFGSRLLLDPAKAGPAGLLLGATLGALIILLGFSGFADDVHELLELLVLEELVRFKVSEDERPALLACFLEPGRMALAPDMRDELIARLASEDMLYGLFCHKR